MAITSSDSGRLASSTSVHRYAQVYYIYVEQGSDKADVILPASGRPQAARTRTT